MSYFFYMYSAYNSGIIPTLFSNIIEQVTSVTVACAIIN
jgi:hypothetical protein